jgi:hypothetical protein
VTDHAPSSLTATADPAYIGKCWKCGYDLRGIESRKCPECGREFDPANVFSFLRAESCGRWAMRYLRPVRWPAQVAKWSMIVLSLAAGGLLIHRTVIVALCVLVYLLIAMPYLVRSLIKRGLVASLRVHPSVLRNDRAVLQSARLWLFGGLLINFWAIPQIIVLAADMPWLDHEARRLYCQVPMLGSYPRSERCGFLHISNVEVNPRGVSFTVSGPWVGIDMLYAGDGPMSPETREQYTQLIGRWYVESW